MSTSDPYLLKAQQTLQELVPLESSKPKTEALSPLDDEAFPWEKLPGEPYAWFDRFSKYARPLGHEFTLRRAFFLYSADHPSEDVREMFPLWRSMAETYRWEKRAAEWASEDEASSRLLWAQRKKELLTQDWETGLKLRNLTFEYLEKINAAREVSRVESSDGTIVVTKELEITVGDLARLAKTSSELQRLAVQEPTAVQNGQNGQNNTVQATQVNIMLPAVDRV